MLDVLGSKRPMCDGTTRRQVLTAGGLSALGGFFDLPSLLALESQKAPAAKPGKAKNVIHIYLHGGAPTQDMFDLKPKAPVQIRGEFKPIATSAPGIQICEHLPKMARWMHRCAIVRSVHHRAGCHNTLPSFSGSEQLVDINDPIPKDTNPPGMGSVCEYLKPSGQDLPAYVALPTSLGWGFLLRRPGSTGGYLGKRCDPLCSEALPVLDKKPAPGRRPLYLGTPFLADTTLGADMSASRLQDRRGLLGQLDDAQRRVVLDSFDRVRQRAFSLLTASKLKSAFNLDNEDPKLRERYGNHLVGNSALVARRLIETGVRFVDVYFEGYSYRFPTNMDTYWDTHAYNFVQLKQANLPCLDQVFDALMDDLERRGLLNETLVVINTDFGRTPQVNGSAGRDHWTYCYSVMLAGAGIRGGTICGASDGHAAFVKDRPVRPADICATIYHCLGIDPDMPVYDRAGRPTAVAHGGEPLREILA